MFSIVKNITKHSLIYGLSSILSRSIGFLLIPLYTHYLTPADYGTLELLDLTSYIVGMLAAMGISNSVMRFYFEYTEQEKKDQVISVALIAAWVIALVFFVISYIFAKNISTLVFESPDYFRMFQIIFASMVFNLSNGIPLTVLRIQEKSVLFITFNFIKTALTLILNVLFIVYFEMGVMGILWSGFIVTGGMGIYLLIYQFSKIKISFSFDLLMPMLKYGIPLAWSTFGMFVVNFADRFFLQRLTTMNELGLYSLAYRFGFLPSIIVMVPFMLVWAPKRFDLVKEPNAKTIYSTIFTYLAFLLIYTGLGICLLIKDVIIIVADPEYFQAYKYVGVILSSYILNGAVLYVQFGIHLRKKTRYLAYATLMTAGINIIANVLLIPVLHAWGAALATLVSYMFLLAYTFIVSQKLYDVPYEYGRIIKLTVLAIAMFTIGIQINPSSVAVSMTVKFLMAFSFPFVLYLFKFYTAEEKAKISQIFGQIYGLVKSKIGKGDS
jgi:O-antigen/teichoic acid export membrane protein